MVQYMRILLAMPQSLEVKYFSHALFVLLSLVYQVGNGRPLILGRKVLTVFHYMSE